MLYHMHDVPPSTAPGHRPAPHAADAGLRDLADEYTRILAAQDPETAARTGLPGQALLPDYSPGALADHAEVTRSLRSRAAALSGDLPEGDRSLRDHLLERLGTDVDFVDSGEGGGYLGYPRSPFQRILNLLRPPVEGPGTVTADDEADAAEVESRWEAEWHLHRTRLEMLPQALAGLTASLERSAQRGFVSSASQVEGAVTRARDFAAQELREVPPEVLHPSLRTEIERARDGARRACLDFASYLGEQLAPRAPRREGVGPQRHRLWMRRHLGTEVDPEKVFGWAQEELRSVIAEQDRLAVDLLGPGADAQALNDHLRRDRSQALSPEGYVVWAQSVADQAWDAVVGRILDLPQGLGRPVVALDRPGGGVRYRRPYGTGGQRQPGLMLRSLGEGDEVLWPWVERTTVLHEAVPGHHAHSGAHAADMRLTLWQRYLGRVPGCDEGWALYAESLGEELGLLDRPEDRFGRLAARRWRLVRVLIDLGVHSYRPVPPEVEALPGASGSWDQATVTAVLRAHTVLSEGFLRYEVAKHLGWPAQSLAHVLGERVWLAGRKAAQASAAAQGRQWGLPELRAFHNRAIRLGSVGLDLLERELC